MFTYFAPKIYNIIALYSQLINFITHYICNWSSDNSTFCFSILFEIIFHMILKLAAGRELSLFAIYRNWCRNYLVRTIILSISTPILLWYCLSWPLARQQVGSGRGPRAYHSRIGSAHIATDPYFSR